MSIISIISTSILMDFTKRSLTYKAWVPFNYSSFAIYNLVYFHQLIAMSTSGMVNVACESLIFGLLLHICGQIEILKYRLTKITHCKDTVRDCVKHHNCIFESVNFHMYKFSKQFLNHILDVILAGLKDFCSNCRYAYTVNNTFAKIIAIQFAVSMLVVCSNLYRIAIATDYLSFVPLLMYTNAILMQIFIYCWFGNEVKLKVHTFIYINNIFVLFYIVQIYYKTRELHICCITK